MNPRRTAVLQVSAVALATVACGLVLINTTAFDSTVAVAVAATSLSAIVGVLTKSLSMVATQRRSEVDELLEELHKKEQEYADTVRKQEQEFLAFSSSQDNLSLLDELLRKEQYRGRVEPPDIALHAIAEVKAASHALASLGKVEQAYAVDEKLRFLLDSHGSVSWLWFLARSDDLAKEGVTHQVFAVDEIRLQVDDDSDTQERP